MKYDNNTYLGIKLPKKIKDELIIVAEKQQMFISEVVRQAIEEYLIKEGK